MRTRARTAAASGKQRTAPAEQQARRATARRWPVALYVPNVVGYARLALVVGAAAAPTFEGQLACYATCGLLDFVDGVLARALNQCSAFGALLDVVVDNTARAIAWHHAGRAWDVPAFAFVPCVEWCVLAATHAEHGAQWRQKVAEDGTEAPPPAFVAAVMANGFKTPIGALAIAGLHVLPAALWCAAPSPALPPSSPTSLGWLVALSRHPAVLAVLLVGRLLAFGVELHVLGRHAARVLRDERRA